MPKTSSPQKFWIIGGTSESVTIVKAIAAHNWPYIVTVTTPEAVNLYREISNLNIQVGQLDQTAIAQFLTAQNILGIIDASHPFAIAISKSVIELSQKLKIPYLRYERPLINKRQTQDNPSRRIIILESFETLLRENYLTNQRVLLTVGAKNLSLFKNWHSQATLFARILPQTTSLQIALEAGFPPERIIAFRPPYSLALELALWQQWQISLVVSKASGEAGGEDLKRQVSEQLNIPLIIINRPPIAYPLQTELLEELLGFCRHIFNAHQNLGRENV